MKSSNLVWCLALAFISGCSASPPPEACTGGTAICAEATKPDVTKTRAHLADHVQYPAKREQILAACASTPEFTDSEKKWFSDHLPEGNYASADDVAKALRL